MRNPILQKGLWTILYFFWWILPSSIHSFVLWKTYKFPIYNIILDSIISFTIFAIIGLSLWYMVRYTFINSTNWKKNLQSNLVAMTLIFLIWIASSYGILYIISSNYSSNFESTILWRFLLFIPVYLLIISIYFSLSSLSKIRDQELQTALMESMVQKAEYNLLKSQINPHFLFNSLNSASSLTITNPEKAQEMIINISDFFRFTLLSSKNQYTSLYKEIENALLYLEIEKGRFGDRIKINSNLPSNLEDIEVPSLILQPLVENAIKHGVYESSKTINISFEFKNISDKIRIRIENEIPENNGSAKKSTATGLNNVRKRLELAYQQEGLLTTEIIDNVFIVNIWIPII